MTVGTEIAKRPVSHIEATPALPGIGAMLDEYMWVHMISSTPITDLMTGRQWTLLGIQGIIKPDLAAPDVRSMRQDFAESFEAIIALLDEAGARWECHPSFAVSGRVKTEKDGSQSFCEIEARVDISLLG